MIKQAHNYSVFLNTSTSTRTHTKYDNKKKKSNNSKYDTTDDA